MPSSNIVQLIKKIAMEAITASKPCDITKGTVTSANPLKISISQKITLPEEFLTIPEYLTDRETDITINGTKQKCTIHNALRAGDKVTLLRQAGGQRYLVLDKEGD